MITKAELIQNAIIADIESGRCREGEKIPSRNQLRKKFDCSRNTVERAVSFLLRQGWLEARQGRDTIVRKRNSTRKEGEIRHLYLISGSPTPLYEQDMKNVFFSEASLSIPVTVLNTAHLPLHSRRIRYSGGAVIWLMPGYEHLQQMDSFASLRIPQLLINRRFRHYSFVMTDCAAGIRNGITALLRSAGPDIAFIGWTENTFMPYQAERLRAFYEACLSPGIRLRPEHVFCRDFRSPEEEMKEAAAAFFRSSTAGPSPRGIFILNIQLATPFLAAAEALGMFPGKDFQLLTFDTLPGPPRPGICMLEQQYPEIYREALRWLNEGFASGEKAFESRIEPRLIIPPDF